jgi:FMN phosphatase YigB (HAD superfamily)
MYLNALLQAQLTPAESAFVGHDAAEIQGAHQAGIVTVAVNYESDVRADYYCQSMLDLLDLDIFQMDRTPVAPVKARSTGVDGL